jgi:hypothetical protein
MSTSSQENEGGRASAMGRTRPCDRCGRPEHTITGEWRFYFTNSGTFTSTDGHVRCGAVKTKDEWKQ